MLNDLYILHLKVLLSWKIVLPLKLELVLRTSEWSTHFFMQKCFLWMVIDEIYVQK